MSARYLFNLTLLLAAGFLVVATQAFAPAAVAWITFGIAVGITCVALPMLLQRRPLQRGVSGLVTVIGVWTIIASLVFAPTTVLWLGFASALGVIALTMASMTDHELTTERVVHSIEVHEHEHEREPIAAA